MNRRLEHFPLVQNHSAVRLYEFPGMGFPPQVPVDLSVGPEFKRIEQIRPRVGQTFAVDKNPIVRIGGHGSLTSPSPTR